MKLQSFILKFLMLCMTIAVASESYYTINAPGVLNPNRKYFVVVSLHQASGPCSMRVGIEGPSFNDFKDVNLQPFETQTVEFLPKQLNAGNYILKVEGLSGLIFENETRLEVLNHGPNIYVQTDKGVYKPKDVVRFRIVILDEHTRPLNIEDPIHVEILDEERNLMTYFKNISLTHGIYTGKFQLPKYPPEGYWQIKVVIDGTYNYSKQKSFNIQSYVLQKFSIYLKTPSDILLEDGNIKVGVYGKYTFDKFVEGNATIKLFNGDLNPPLQSKIIDVENIGYVDFNIRDIKDINETDGFRVEVTFKEKSTGKARYDEENINIRKQRYNLEIPFNEIEFENNKPYSINVYVKHWTGAPVLDYKTPVTMEHGGKVYEVFLDNSGMATFVFDHDAKTDHKFQFKNSTAVFPNIYVNNNLMLNNREFYCRLKLVDEKLKLGKPVLIEVSSIVNIPYLMYVVMGHASVVRHGYVKVPPNQKSYTIEITPSIEMIPQSFIYVYYVHKGNLSYEEMSLSFPYEFENQVAISAPIQVKPGEQVTININAQPKSYVGILAVDLGVYIMQKKYDFNKLGILNDLNLERSYSSMTASAYPGIISGLLTLTNAHYPVEYISPPPLPTYDYYGDPFIFRKKFPETWIFENYLINETETALTLQIPDAITTWRITAFSNNNVTGFGIVDGSTNILAMQPFFISLNLPYSVKRGEIVTIPMTIFNYFNETQDAEVVLHNDDRDFYFMESNIQGVEKLNDNQQQKKNVSIATEKYKTVNFLIYTVKSGEISIKVTATSSMYTDAILQKLKVEPEGVSKQQNEVLYLSIPAGEKISSAFSIKEPVASVPDSDYITFSVGGHYLVPTIENFQDLIQMPTGSGDQIMIHFAPIVLILQYLKANGKLSQEKKLVESLKMSIEAGYQQQLSFRHRDGGYSIFGVGIDEKPSTWLTAYVVRYFIKASEFLDTEARVIEADLEYLAEQQKSNGEFLFTGYLLNPHHKNPYGLTAFILLAFLEDPHYAEKYSKTIENAIGFLNANLNSTSDINALCLMAGAIKRTKLHNADALIDHLKSLSKENNGLRWWSGNDQNPATDIEITANAALTLLDTPGDYTSILKWLIQQRNANGGFKSCYDTVVGLEALVKFSEKYKNVKNVNLKIAYRAMDDMGNEVVHDEFHIDTNNVLSLQKRELPQTARHVTFEMEGNGASLVQLNHQYNVDNVQEFRYFDIKVEPISRNTEEFILNLCFTYLSDTDSGTLNDITNMVVIEVNVPSGFRFEEYNTQSLWDSKVKKFEVKNSDSIVLYLDKLDSNVSYCLEIPVDKGNEILMPKPAAIIMYDYYNLTRSNTVFYSI